MMIILTEERLQQADLRARAENTQHGRAHLICRMNHEQKQQNYADLWMAQQNTQALIGANLSFNVTSRNFVI
jgi:hypothetical protein